MNFHSFFDSQFIDDKIVNTWAIKIINIYSETTENFA
jgi:hypothetical protein